MAQSSRRSLDLVELVSGGRRSSFPLVAVALTIVVVFGVMQLGARMMAGGGGFPLLRLRQMKLTVPGTGDHGEDPRLTCHKDSFFSLTMTRFISLKSILVFEGALLDLGLAVAHLLFWRCHGGSGGRWWTTFQRGTRCFKGGIVILLLAGFFMQFFLTSVFVLCGDHIYV